MFKNGELLLVLILSTSIIITVNCAKILQIFSFPSRSINMAGTTMAEILAEKGHNVTYVSPFQISPPPESFKHIFLSEVSNYNAGNKLNYFEYDINFFYQAYVWYRVGATYANATFQDPKFKQVLNETYDLVIMNVELVEAIMYVAEYLNTSLLLYTSLHAAYWTNPILGNPEPPSYVPLTFSSYTNSMTFFQRFHNSLMYIAAEIIRNFVGLPAHDKVVQENFPGAPNIYKYYNKASVILLNSDVSVMDPMPMVPGMIDIGGFHIRPPKTLPEDLEEVMNDAEYGVIYFSLGSNLKSTDMPEETVRALLRVFSELKETVLWKWEDENLSGRHKNVVIRKWFPQNDLLAHKNVKLFITHGGFHSIIETVYHGVPCVVLPVLGDQIPNAKRAKEFGFAEWIKFNEITESRFRWTVNQLLGNVRYTEAVKQRSSILRDKPLPQADMLGFWVDYVIRHKGADHLKVASLSLTWYQYLLLDVLSGIIIGLACFITVIYLCIYLMKTNTIKEKLV